VGAAAAAYSEQHGRGQLGGWTRGNVNNVSLLLGLFQSLTGQ